MHLSRWNTRQDNIVKLCLIEAIEACRVTREVFLSLYVSLVEEEENVVKLPAFYKAFLSSPTFLVSHHVNELDVSLLRDTKETHHMLLCMLVSLFVSAPPPKSEECSHTKRRLLNAAKRLGYADILWLYASRLANPERYVVELQSVDEKMSDHFLRFLCAQKESIFEIDTTHFGVYELRTTSLFRSVVSLLLRERRYEKVNEAFRFIKTVLGVEDPLYYLSERSKVLYKLNVVTPIKT